ncbi:hypothetical protein ACYTX9_09605, partial [Streptococcus pyogenes]
MQLMRFGNLETVYINFIYDALVDPEGKISGVISLGYDVTDLVKAKKHAEQIASNLEAANVDVLSKNLQL